MFHRLKSQHSKIFLKHVKNKSLLNKLFFYNLFIQNDTFIQSSVV